MGSNNSNWLRFRLSTLLLLITCCALTVGWLADSHRNRQTIARNKEEHQAQLLDLKKQQQTEVLQLNRKLGRFRRAANVVKSFQVASFREKEISEEEIRFMSRFPELRKLELSHSNLTPQKLELIAELRQLESLNLAHNPRLTDESLSCLQNLPRLREIELTACTGISATGVQKLGKIRALERVRLDPKLRVAAADLVTAVPGCVVVFENSNKIESFGILAEFNERQTVFENTVRRELEDSLDPTNKRRFGSLRQPPLRSRQTVKAKAAPSIDDVEEQSLFLQALETFISNPRDESACNNMLDTSHDTALRALKDSPASRRAFYLLARLNKDRTNPDLASELFRLRFSVVKRVAQATFWPQALTQPKGGNVYFLSCEKIEGATAVNVLSIMATDANREINSLSLIHKRMFVFAVERPELDGANVYYGDIGRYLYKPDSVQRYDCRSCLEEIPMGMELPIIELTQDQSIEWIQNSNRTPIWSVEYLPESGPFGSEHLTPK